MQEAKNKTSKKQLDSTRKTFLSFVKDRVTSTTPNRDSPRFNSGHITEQLLNMNSGLKTSGNPRNGSLPRLAGGPQNNDFPSKALNSEYSSFVTTTFNTNKRGVGAAQGMRSVTGGTSAARLGELQRTQRIGSQIALTT